MDLLMFHTEKNIPLGSESTRTEYGPQGNVILGVNFTGDDAASVSVIWTSSSFKDEEVHISLIR